MTFFSEPSFLETRDKDNNAINENNKTPHVLLPKDEIEQGNIVHNTTVDTAEEGNKSETGNENLTIPVFSEWTQQQIQEAEKLSTNSTEPNKDIKNETLAKHQIVKMRQKNYASPDCGAKVLASNPEAQSTSSVLTDKDEYLLSPCTERIWFVIELCDSIQAQRVELANFELFSSPLKSVSISVSNRFPTRDWTFAGQFDAKSERDVQVLDLSSSLFGKFVRVDLTYTNTEHYCPLSFFRIFGTSEIEAFEVENEPTNEFKDRIEDDDEYEHHLKDKVKQPNNNLLNRAGAAVMSIVNKAAEVLAKSNDNGRKSNETSDKIFDDNCVTLSHNILCQHCSTNERLELDNLISCKSSALSSLLSSSNDIRNYLVNSVTCHDVLGFDLKTDKPETSSNFIMSILPQKYIDALCNMVATDQKALPLRIEDIPGIHSNLISKKDEVSLKNISKKEAPAEEDPLCKQDFYTTTTDTPEVNPTTDENIVKETPQVVESIEEQKNRSVTGDELNIFNVVEQQKQDDASSDPVSASTEPPKEITDEPANSDKTSESEVVKQEVNFELVTDPSQPPTTASPDSSEVIDNPPEVKVVEQSEVKAHQDSKPENNEIKINGDYRSSNPPESVFLRLSNRIKTLEKNMTLSTQYLEELSRRYKKQIEDLQHSFAKLQTIIDDQSNKKRESDKRDEDDKKRLQENVEDLNQKFEYMEVILIVVVAFFVVQTILVIALFKRISILRKTFAAHQQRQETIVAPPSSQSQINHEKSRSTGRKRSKQRTRKISAPNILTQRSPVKGEFLHELPTLSRTVSAPNKFNGVSSMTENKENYDEMKAMLEENDDILIPGFEDLKLNDDSSIKSNDLDTASTVSAVSSNGKHEQSSSNKSFKFKRRLSSPFQKSLKKSSSDRTNQTWGKKAMSESPPRVMNENPIEIHKSKSFHDDDEGSVKFKKSNSFKKLFKKLF